MDKSIVLVVILVAGLVSGRHINQAGLKLIKSFEGFRSHFYKDAVGIKTIGYGHACHAHSCSHIHAPISERQASDLLRHDLASYEHCVESHLPGLDGDKFAALVSFVYNLGCGTLTKSQLAHDIRGHHYRAAAGQFARYVHAGHRVLPGLVRRRHAERALFCRSGGC